MTIQFQTKKVFFTGQNTDSTLATTVEAEFATNVMNAQTALQSFQIKPGGAREIGILEINLEPATFTGNKVTCEANVTFYAKNQNAEIKGDDSYFRVLFIADCE